jgi:hypothetical protein
MKAKKIFLSAVIALTFFSCSKDNEETSVASKQPEKAVLKFANEKEMQSKITEIEAFKNQQETEITQKILDRKHMIAPNPNDIENLKQVSLKDLDQNAIMEDLKFYHNLKLNAIYEERAHFGFTSIQSIADEINSLKLLNPAKADDLYTQYNSLLNKNEFETSTTFSKEKSLIINKKGVLLLNDKSVAENYLKINSNEAFKTAIKSGILATGYNNFMIITYQAGFEFGSASIISGYDSNGNPIYAFVTTITPYNGLYSYVLSQTGYVFYPCYFYTNPSSVAHYSVYCQSPNLTFLSGYGTSVEWFAGTYIPTYYCPNSNNNVNGNVSGNFAIPVGSGFLWASGSKTF